MSRNYTFKELLNYKIDKVLTKGTPILVLLLTIFSFIIVIIIGLIAFLYNSTWADGSEVFSVWKTIMFLLDAGTLANETSSVFIVFLMTVVTLLGIFVTSTLIGIINNGLQDRIFMLRNGNSKVIETDHTVILGFNEGVFSLLLELIKANENKKSAVIVVLGHLDKPIMEDFINQRISNKKTTTIVCHSGSTSDIIALDKCSISQCKSIIINEKSDFNAIKSLIAVVNILEKHEAKKPYMTVVINEKRNLCVARLASKGYAEVLYFNEIISRIIANTSHQPGLSKVFIDLFDFDGDEIYFEKFPELVGKRYSEVLTCFLKSTVIGIKNGVCKLNPPMDTIIGNEDFLILIAKDDGISKVTSNLFTINDSNFKAGNLNNKEKKTERILILEFNPLLDGVLLELSNYLSSDSKITVVHSRDFDHGIVVNQHTINIEYIKADIYDPDVLKSFVCNNFNSVLLMSDFGLDDEMADAKVLMLLMHLRNIIQTEKLEISVTSEMKDVRNQELATTADVSDFVVSSNIISLMVSQISENRDLSVVFNELLAAEGSEIYIRPSTRYAHADTTISYGELCLYLAKYNEVLIGLRKAKLVNGVKQIEIQLNPIKTELIKISELLSFILISED